MKFWTKSIAGTLCVLLLSISNVQAAETFPLEPTEKVYQFLTENHLSRPQEPQLVKGALKGVTEEAAKVKHITLTSVAEDDTMGELETRLLDWHTKQGLDWDELNRWAIDGMIDTLNDPYTNYFSKEQLKGFQSAVENEFVGFGVRFRIVNGEFAVKEVIPDSPAAKAMMKTGDIVLSVDSFRLSGKTLEEVYKGLKGEEGTKAIFHIYRPSLKKNMDIMLTREALVLPEVSAKRFQQSIGYISLTTFGSEAGTQFRDGLNKIMSQNPQLQGLIIDLRDNSGGYLSAARDVASLFMEDGLLMYTEDRSGIQIETWVHNGRTVDFPVRILVNQGTASASELLSGALRDNGKAKLVGSKTFGKGVAQQIIPFEDGNALKITLQEYFTPKHTEVNHIGLTPDIVVKDDTAQVIEALRSLDVKRFDIREILGEGISINGVDFYSASPIFQKGKQGVSIRKGVLASLLGKPELEGDGYINLAPYLGKQMSLHSSDGQTALSYQAK
ncbi:S41 family peptidase [Brevibacillus ginsengisoli]|uniref:S41 family peptidase n=1 Tax=Brevibacillus ginsengisoli TaxID=363854 RepID=UPI003CF64F1C